MALLGGPSRRPHKEVAYEEERTDQEVASSAPLELAHFAVLPEPGDNCAILRRRLEAGTRVRLSSDEVVTVTATVLEGHRIAVVPIPEGGQLLSWGLPFAVATRGISAGEYVCNEPVLAALRLRHIEGLPESPNFEDLILPHSVDEASFSAAEQVPLLPPHERLSFMGFDRSGAQGGVGTRNFVAVIPTSALASPYARRLAESFRSAASGFRNCNGVVSCSHTEAAVEAGGPRPKNWDLILRTLSGFVSHPNVAAALVVGHSGELLTPKVLREHMEVAGYALPKWATFLELTGDFEADLKAGREVVMPWLPEVDGLERTPQPLSHLSVALQCGGSDAFSGVSGNPAAGHAAKLLIEHGGAAVLAETDELIGAESYVLSRVRNLETAKKFLHQVERFKERFSWHGQSAESNPSGGNRLRGLYNIALKSLGAAKKKHAEVSLDGVLEYSERLAPGTRGYYFLDSPGNDLESIAGQVASGCNVIFFTTGNGSITNFPFVPTLKIITTSERYRLLQHDMDFNAGRFQDEGVEMAALGAELFASLVAAASGAETVGERAGHSQVSIWREWALDGPPGEADKANLAVGDREGLPLQLRPATGSEVEVEVGVVRAAVVDTGAPTAGFQGAERLGLVLPTSLCSGEVARKVAEEMESLRGQDSEEENSEALAKAVDRFVALPHTEGCGIGYAGDGERLFSRVILGHLLHSNVVLALMLEHGCEKTHNAWMTEELKQHGVDASRFGFASVQLDGGIDKATAKVRQWFSEQASRLAANPTPSLPAQLPLASLPVALLGGSGCGGAAQLAVALLRAFVGAGGTVVVPADAAVLRSAPFLDELAVGRGSAPSLAFAQPARQAGAHVMHVPLGAGSRFEVITALVATGAGALLVINDTSTCRSLPVVGHPMVPVLHIAVDDEGEGGTTDPRWDLHLGSRAGENDDQRRLRWLRAAVALLCDALSRRTRPRAADTVGFQVARGPTGVSC